MYAARRRQKSVQWKFQFGKLGIGQQFQLFDNTLRQFPQGGFVRHQVALHEPQLVDKPQILIHVPHRSGVLCQTAQHETDVVGVTPTRIDALFSDFKKDGYSVRQVLHQLA